MDDVTPQTKELVAAILRDAALSDDNKYRMLALVWRARDPQFDFEAVTAALIAHDFELYDRLVVGDDAL